MALLGARFPLIVKLIDAGDWLSLQVHPDDALARELYGPRRRRQDRGVARDRRRSGRTARDRTRRRTSPRTALREAIAAGTASHQHCHRRPAVPGETLLIRAGTLHAIGAGAFVYEIEQPSDLTFRISDWGRPTGRTLHVAEALRALRPALHAEPAGSGFRLDGGALEVPEFRLELPDLAAPVHRQPGWSLVRGRHGDPGHAPGHRRRLVGDARPVRDAGGPGSRRCLRDHGPRRRHRLRRQPSLRVARRSLEAARGAARARAEVPASTRSRQPGGAAPRGSRPGRAPRGRSPRRDRRRRRGGCPPEGPAGRPPRGRS